MKELGPPDIHHFNAAQGWLGLNSPNDAQAELDKVSGQNRTHLGVMELQWHIHAKIKKWQAAIETACAITNKHPDNSFGWVHFAFALHEIKRTREAYDLLTPVIDKFPNDWLMRYNMACYAVQLGDVNEGKRWLERARNVGDNAEIDKLVATDPDLAPLRKTG